LLGVLVDLVLLELAPLEVTPDDVAVLIDAGPVGSVEVIGAADADRLTPRESLDDHLVGRDLEAHANEALEPCPDLCFPADHAGPRAVTGEGELDVGGVHPQCGRDVARIEPSHRVAQQLLSQPALHGVLLRSRAIVLSRRYTSAMPTDTRDRLVDAGAELLRRQGYSATGIKQIVEEARAPVASLYHFFPGGKEQLGAEVIRTAGPLYEQLIPAVFDPAPDLVTGIRWFFAGAAG